MPTAPSLAARYLRHVPRPLLRPASRTLMPFKRSSREGRSISEAIGAAEVQESRSMRLSFSLQRPLGRRASLVISLAVFLSSARRATSLTSGCVAALQHAAAPLSWSADIAMSKRGKAEPARGPVRAKRSALDPSAALLTVIAANLKRLRTRQGHSLERLANLAGVSHW